MNSNLFYREYPQLVRLPNYIGQSGIGCDATNPTFDPKRSSNAVAAIPPSGSRSSPVGELVAIGTGRLLA